LKKLLRETMSEDQQKAEELLGNLMRNKHVSRWDVYRNRKQIRELIQREEIYKELEYEVEDLIDSATESL